MKKSIKKYMPFLTAFVLAPVPVIFEKCSKQTQQNMHTMSQVLAYTIIICGTVLGISLSQFCFAGHIISYFITIPIGIGLYWLIDRLVVMADAKKNAAFIKSSRFFIGLVLGTFNSLLVHNAFYYDDIQAEITKEVVVEQARIQAEADSAIYTIQLHKEGIYDNIDHEAETLHERNDDLVAEAEGLSPSGHIGMGPVYAAKKEAFSRDSLEFERVRNVMMTEAAKDDSAMAALAKETAVKKAQAHHQVSTGFNHTVELLHKVIVRKPLNIFIAILFFVLCIILELLPFLAKHYLNIDEYFKHAWTHREAYEANQELHKEHTQAEVKHESITRHMYRMQAITYRFVIATLKQKARHSERIAALTGQHFSVLVEQEESHSICYPEQFEEYIKPVFTTAYKQFDKNQQEAFKADATSFTNPKK